ncbi:hypothetical protein ACHWQZ_G004744 [Mnemiopsis leidyi]
MYQGIKLIIPSSKSIRLSALNRIRFLSTVDHLVTSSPSVNTSHARKFNVFPSDQTEPVDSPSVSPGKLPDEIEKFHSIDSGVSQTGSVDNIHVKVLFPYYARKDIIGLQGEHIQRLQLDFNCKVQIAPYGHLFPGTLETILLIEGSKDNVMKVMGRVRDVVKTVDLPMKLKRFEWARQRTNCLNILVPLKWGETFKYCDGGKLLKSMAEKHSLDHVYCLNKQRNSVSTEGLMESIVALKGGSEEVMRAGEELIDMMKADGELLNISKDLMYKHFYHEPSSLVRVKMLLPSYVIGKFMGSGSEALKYLRADMDCSIKLSKYGHLFPGSLERVLMIEGKDENVIKVIKKVNDLLDGESDVRDDLPEVTWNKHRHKQLKFVVPLAWGQKLIRDRGEMLKTIQMNNKLMFVNMDKSCCSSAPELREAVVTLGGEKENLLEAGLELFGMMSEDGEKCQVNDNLNYQQFSLDSDVSVDVDKNASKNQMHVKTLLPVYAVKKFLGTDGRNVKFLASLWNCRLTASTYLHVYPGTNERVLLIQGARESVLNVLKEVRSVIRTVNIPVKWKNQHWVKDRHKDLRLLIPASLASELLENDGALLNDLKEKFELDVIFLKKSSEHYETNEAIIGMKGDDEHCLKAADYVLFEMLAGNADSEKSSVDTNLDYGKYFLKSSEEKRKPLWHFTLPDSFLT